jgi:hypothetical protein
LNSGLVRAVHVVPETTGEFQSLYLDLERNRLRPNLTFVRRDGTIYFETNELGLKGEARDPQRRLAVVWGDSVVFGIGAGWPTLLNDYFTGYQFLNGGVEGSNCQQVLQRAVAFNREHSIALNIILIGWHTYVQMNANVRDDLTAAVAAVPHLVLATMPTALNRNLLGEDLSPFFKGTDLSSGFYFFGNVEYSPENLVRVFQYIVERNRIVCEVAAAAAVPVIDLFAAFNTEHQTDFRQDFFDVMHPRPSAYPKLAQAVADGIAPVLAARSDVPPATCGIAPPRGRSWLAGIRKLLAGGASGYPT